ncbi:MAG TPA: hypothetical protein VF681_15795 [Abditibacteriaceae bacterium]
MPFSQEPQSQSEQREVLSASRWRRAAIYMGEHSSSTQNSLETRHDSNDRRRDITQVLGDALGRVLLQGSDAELAAVERWIEHKK